MKTANAAIKTGTRRIIRLDELSTEVSLRMTTKLDTLSRRITRLVPVFILDDVNRRMQFLVWAHWAQISFKHFSEQI